jgi:hypothetical protein
MASMVRPTKQQPPGRPLPHRQPARVARPVQVFLPIGVRRAQRVGRDEHATMGNGIRLGQVADQQRPIAGVMRPGCMRRRATPSNSERNIPRDVCADDHKYSSPPVACLSWPRQPRDGHPRCGSTIPTPIPDRAKNPMRSSGRARGIPFAPSPRCRHAVHASRYPRWPARTTFLGQQVQDAAFLRD